MDIVNIKGKCLYSPKGAAREYAPIGCNFYRGCPHQCLYCYLRKGRNATVLGTDHAILKNEFTNMDIRPKKYRHLSPEDYAIVVYRREVDRHLSYLRNTGIFFSFTTDPMVSSTIALTMSAMLYAVGKGIPVRILTKNADYSDVDMTVFKNIPASLRKLIYIGFTLTGCDDQEPNASPNSARIIMMRRFHEWGYNTFASIEPIVNFVSSMNMITDTLGFCDMYMIGLMNHARDYYKSYNGKFRLDELIRTVFILQQIHGFMVYYKESVMDHDIELLHELYMNNTTPYQVGVSSEIYGSLYDWRDDRTPLQKAVNALTHLNKYMQDMSPCEEPAGIHFLLSQYHRVFADGEPVERFIDDFMASPDSCFSEKISTFYLDLTLLQDAAIKMYYKIIIKSLPAAGDEDEKMLLERLHKHITHLHDTALATKVEIQNTKPLSL